MKKYANKLKQYEAIAIIFVFLDDDLVFDD